MSTHYYPALRNCGSCASLAGSLQEFNSSSSLNNRTSSFSPYGEIQNTAQLVEQIAFLYLNEEFSDLVLIVDGQRFPVHRVILATRSSYFKAMLYGGMRESSEKEVTLFDTPVQAFQAVLKYIYTGKLQLKSLELSLVLDMLALVHKYGFSELEAAIPEYLKSILKARNSWRSPAWISSTITPQTFCPDNLFFNYPPQHSSEYSAETLFVRPNWKYFLPSAIGLMHTPKSPLASLRADQILDAIKEQNTKRSSELNYRGFLFPGTNVATPLLGAKVTGGDFRSALLSNKTSEDETSAADPIDRTYAKHLINQTNSGITIELGRPFILNNIRLHLMDRDQRTYSYFIEVSVDQVDWVRVIDHSHYVCRSRQNLLFDERVVKFIRVIGTHCSVNNTFQLSRFEAMYVTDSCAIDNSTTLQIPRLNIATIANNAIVVEGVSRSRNALLNGDTKNYDWDDGYTCHQLGSGALVVQLPQPFLVETMRLLLWDCDDRWYSFYIEVSTDQCKWAKVAEVNECRSWQTVHFLRQPVVFIRIVGTHNSANEVFHCVHFECPAMETDSASEEERVARLRRIIAHTVDEDALSATVQTSSNGIVPVEKFEFLESCQNALGAIVESIAAGVGEEVGSQEEGEERQAEGRPNHSLFGDIDQQEGSSSGRAESESSHSETVYEENRDRESMPPMESHETSN
uniref:BTB domain-containing protein n=1 Tax=Globodera rostochiensis TaxID=31243 RepID=A0A914GXA8_GLORO